MYKGFILETLNSQLLGMAIWDTTTLSLSITSCNGCKVQTQAKLMKLHSEAFYFKFWDVSCHEVLNFAMKFSNTSMKFGDEIVGFLTYV